MGDFLSITKQDYGWPYERMLAMIPPPDPSALQRALEKWEKSEGMCSLERADGKREEKRGEGVVREGMYAADGEATPDEEETLMMDCLMKITHEKNELERKLHDPAFREERMRYKTIYKTDFAEADALIDRLYKSRLKSTYDVSYTIPISKRRSLGDEEEENAPDEASEKDNMLMQFKQIYWEESCPRPRPAPPTSRKIFGQARPDQLLIGMSEYQDRLGRLGYRKLAEKEEDKEAS